MAGELVVELLRPLLFLHEDEHGRHQLALSDQVAQENQLSQLVRAVLDALFNLLEDSVPPTNLDAHTVVQVGSQHLLHCMLDGGGKQRVGWMELQEEVQETLHLLEKG
jgi:hypothetical protein